MPGALMPGRTHRLLFAACAALLSSAAFAQEEPPPPPPPGIETAGAAGQNQPDARSGSQNFADPSQLFSGTPGAFVGVGFGKIDKDTYVSTVINTELALGPFAVGLGVPLNLLAINDDSTGTRDSKTYEHVLRRSDWNQAQDYLKFVRFVRYGHKREPLYLLAGQLWGSTLGHGTLVNRYSNSLSLDQRKFGIAFDFNSDYFGVETLARLDREADIMQYVWTLGIAKTHSVEAHFRGERQPFFCWQRWLPRLLHHWHSIQDGKNGLGSRHGNHAAMVQA